MAKMPSKARTIVVRVARVIGLLAALAVYVLAPLHGRASLGVATVLAGLAGYALVLSVTGWGFNKLNGTPSRKAAR
jgi:hypothetical protein